MNKTYLLFKHEFVQAIKKGGYIILTLFVPLAAMLAIGIGQLVSSLTDPPIKEILDIGYVDQAGLITDLSEDGMIKLYPFGSAEEAKAALLEGEISEYIIIQDDYLITGTIQRYTLAKELATSPVTAYAIESFLTINLLSGNVEDEIVRSIVSPLTIDVIRLDNEGEISQAQGNMGNIIIPALYGFLLSMAFQFGSSSLITGLGEEKESRLIEVLNSSVSVHQLLFGKVTALGAAGLLQVMLWLASAPLILNLASATFEGFITGIQIPPNFVVLGIVYFVLGYLLFAILAVTIGGISSSTNDAHSISMIYILVGYIPLWSFGALINFPDSPIWVALSFFPITAPVQTMLRLGVSEIPVWQIAVSISVLILAIGGGLYLSEKTFRAFMLMYGKRPRLGEIIRSLRNS